MITVFKFKPFALAAVLLLLTQDCILQPLAEYLFLFMCDSVSLTGSLLASTVSCMHTYESQAHYEILAYLLELTYSLF